MLGKSRKVQGSIGTRGSLAESWSGTELFPGSEMWRREARRWVEIPPAPLLLHCAAPAARKPRPISPHFCLLARSLFIEWKDLLQDILKKDRTGNSAAALCRAARKPPVGWPQPISPHSLLQHFAFQLQILFWRWGRPSSGKSDYKR